MIAADRQSISLSRRHVAARSFDAGSTGIGCGGPAVGREEMKSVLWIGLICAAGLAGCAKPASRSTQFFEAHIDEARRVDAACRSGSAGGDECGNASIAVQEADAKERFKRFVGK
jgi:hypothetical protein